MTACIFNVFIIITTYLNFILLPSHGFKVTQPLNRSINPDGSATISCEHTADVKSVKDVRLNIISPPTHKPRMLCQKEKKDCKNITMYQESSQKWLFIIFNIGPEAMSVKYQCEVTATKNDLDFSETGQATRLLLPGQPEPPVSTNPPKTPSQPQNLRWILIGLLALMMLYICVITSCYIRLRSSSKDPENSTYVEMRKAPPPRNIEPCYM